MEDIDIVEDFNLGEVPQEKVDIVFNETIEYFEKVELIDMSRMQGQIEYARKIIEAYRDGRENVIIQAPTGFGKSLLGFFLAVFFEKIEDRTNSYILTSNKFLQEQYQNDIKNFKMDNFAMLKGQSNYSCDENGETFVKRACIDQSIGEVLKNSSKWPCVHKCGYIQTRLKAIDSDTTIFNYSYWLTSMNKVYASLGEFSPFQPRTLTIFDETHVLGNVVQDMYSYELNLNQYIKRTIQYFGMLDTRLGKMNEKPQDYNKICDIAQFIYSSIDNTSLVYENIKKLHTELSNVHLMFDKVITNLISTLPKKDGKPVITSTDSPFITHNEYLFNLCKSLSELIDLYGNLGIETIVASVLKNDTNFHKTIPNYGISADKTIRLQCTNESKLCEKYVHEYTRYGLFMSATLGDMDDYATQTGIDNYVTIDVPQVFNYDESPIYKVTPMLSMNYNNKAMNTPKIIKRAQSIIESHENERGLIHTGTFELMNALKELNNPRLLFYSNSQEKEEIIKLLESRPDAVVCGPSLIEGVDMKDDLCRFMLFLKVPFLSMGDRLVKKKMNVYPNWYGWNTMCSFLQGIGRGVRNNKDWCKTYLLDASFNSFLYRTRPPKFVNDRIKIMSSSSIGQEINLDLDAGLDDW